MCPSWWPDRDVIIHDEMKQYLPTWRAGIRRYSFPVGKAGIWYLFQAWMAGTSWLRMIGRTRRGYEMGDPLQEFLVLLSAPVIKAEVPAVFTGLPIHSCSKPSDEDSRNNEQQTRYRPHGGAMSGRVVVV
jgi:hypothetical protein